MPESNRGVLLGAGAYLMWGLSTLYWPLVSAAGATEVIAHRMVWSLFTVLALLALRAHWRWLLPVLRRPRQLAMLAGAAAVISVNWGLFVYTVNSGQTSQAALGYFINPLVSVLVGVLLFAERLRRAQVAAVALGAVAVAVLSVAYGGVPWLSLGMACSFATYGALKKTAGLDGVESLAVETLLLFVPAAGYIAFLQVGGSGTFTAESPWHTAALVGSGVVTALPLLAFGAAARRVPLSMLGLLQFIVPVMQFLFAWLVFEEPMPASRWVGFAIVWLALVVFVTDMLRTARRTPGGEAAPSGAARSPRGGRAAPRSAHKAAKWPDPDEPVA
ncbi:EamA family transporter RarD [Streptomonospora litoralis]|uniref:EamA-like transporter family protein n=1 Tax=Streptomonospora litoralis TaxID=2498135 RepID=A0A4P6Q9Q3_9ACTN|nr:EamA family transporter RarD [Streptomonospora litoralis]QBI56024.1 EamA-like transporter family protein [Streptomonospora litoralis]